MTEKTWLDYLTAFGSVATPILVLVLTGIGWRLRARIERQLALEDKLREDRIGTYDAILKPFIILLMSDSAWQSDPKNKNRDKNEISMRTLLSLEYREQGLRLSLVGSDSVVKAYNNLMRYFYQRSQEASPAYEGDIKKMMGLLGQFLLEIRRSMGNEATKLSTVFHNYGDVFSRSSGRCHFLGFQLRQQLGEVGSRKGPLKWSGGLLISCLSPQEGSRPRRSEPQKYVTVIMKSSTKQL